MLEQALTIIGDRDMVSSRELVNRLMPDWQQEHGTMQRAGYALRQSLGVSPRHFESGGRWRSVYRREDLQSKLPAIVAHQERRARTGPWCANCNADHPGGAGNCQACGSDMIANRAAAAMTP
jgi:hypothetical protein